MLVIAGWYGESSECKLHEQAGPGKKYPINSCEMDDTSRKVVSADPRMAALALCGQLESARKRVSNFLNNGVQGRMLVLSHGYEEAVQHEASAIWGLEYGESQGDLAAFVPHICTSSV